MTAAPGVSGAPGDVSTRLLVRRALVALGIGVAYLAWLLADVGSARLTALVSDLVFVAAPLAAAWYARQAHERDRDQHTGWWWISLGCLVWAFGSVAWVGYDVVLHVTAPLPSLADLGYVGYSVPVVVGLTKFPRVGGTVWSLWRGRLDSAVIAGCLLVASAVWVLDPIVDAISMTATRVAAMTYPLADLVVASIVLARCVVLPDTRRLVWVPLSLGWLVLAVTDSIYVARNYAGEFRPGSVVDLGWYVAFALVALAAVAPPPRLRAGVDVAQRAPGFTRHLFPSVAIALAVVACLTDPLAISRHHHTWLLVAVGVLVAVRQLVVVADHVTLARDLTDAVDRRTGELKHREQWWQDLVQNLTDVVMVIDRSGTVVYCSPAVNTALGHWPQLPRTDELLTQVHPDDEPAVVAAISPVLAGEQRRGFVACRVRRNDDGYGWFEVQAVGQLEERALEGAVLTLHDVSERQELTDRLRHQAHHDALTGLANRVLLSERIGEALAAAGPRRFGLLLLDLDDFKVINDRHGHESGDIVLTVIGQRLAGLVRAGDTVARLGGDEFAQLVHGSADELRAVAERVVASISEPIVAGGRRFVVRASVGIVLAGDDADESARSLLSHADIALYEAKANDKGGVVLIAGTEREAAAHKVHLKEQIAAPDLSQFSVVYQPIVDLNDGALRGVESLLRWNHPDLGAVPPDVFIPMAEHGGSIHTLGWHVLRESCAQLARWGREFPDRRLAVGVNASVRQLDEPGFAPRLLELVAELGVEPDQIVLELTEQALAVDFDTAVAVVAELRAGGVSVAVDDYGTGYSSLRYLDRFDADVMKIDRSFVWNVVDSVHTQKIVGSVLHMAESLDLQSIAEGIETRAQLEVVRALGCELGQGYLFSRPVAPEEISRLLAGASASVFDVGPDDPAQVLTPAG